MPYKRPSVVCVAMILEMHCSARTARSNEALREYPRQSDRGWASLFPCTHFIRPKALGFAHHEANDRLADSGEKKAYRAVMGES